ncbi:MAG: sensor domain-containing protein [Chloroflexi bacterium]|nr:sensor domain-containing protein [Chloroflexota bacterium]
MSTSKRFFGVITEPQSYINIFYLLLAFPLGIAYFVFLVTGISLGAGLIIIWVGVPILALVFTVSWAIREFERILATALLKEDIPRTIGTPTAITDENLSALERLYIAAWRRFKSHLTNRLTWTGMLYLFLKFPLGIGSFVMVVVLVSVTGALLGAPFYYWVDDGIDLGTWQVDVVWEALLLTLAGIPLAFIALHLMNGAAFLQGRLARVMLGPIGQTEVAGDT